MFFRRFPLSGAWDTSHYPKDVPFEVPAGWVWTTLDSIARFSGGKTPSMDDKANWDNGKHLWITSKDMKSEAICNSQIMLSDSGLQGMTIHQPGTILMVNRSGILRRTLPLGILQKEATINQDLKAITPFMFELTPFLFFCLKAFEPIILQKYKKAGTTVDNINFDHFVTIPIPLPPIQEQGRIVQSIQTWTSRIEDIEKSSDQIQNAIEATKNIILELAIHGKIVAQDPSEEPAIESLKRINSAFQPSHNLHYEGNVPTGWVTTRLGDIVDIISGTSFQKTDITTPGTGLKILRGGNIQNGHIVLCDDDIHISEQLINERANVKKGDIVIVASTGSSELIGKAALSYQNYPRTQIGAFLRIIRPRSVELSDYLGIIFQSELYKKHIREVAKGTNINNIKASYITDFMVPMPPLNEQKRIILKLRALLDILNTINYPE